MNGGVVLDRLVSGAGAVADAADAWTHGFDGGTETRILRGRPGSIVVAILAFALAGLLVLVGIEASVASTSRAVAAGALADGDLGQRVYATVDGSLVSTYVETYMDWNDNDVQDPDEVGDAWYYWIVDPTDQTGVTIRSERPPSEVFTARFQGIVTEDPEYVSWDVDYFRDQADAAGLNLEQTSYVDARDPIDVGAAEGLPLDLAAPTPPDGTPVEIVGSRMVAYSANCSEDARDLNGNEVCEDDEADSWDIVVYDPASKRAITVVVPTSPAFSPTTVTGVLRRDERAVDEAKVAGGQEFGQYELDVSSHYLLSDGEPPSGSALAFVLAIVFALFGGVIVIGLAGGYLAYRRSTDPLPVPATTMRPGERIPVRVTGTIRTPRGITHVREASAELVRFVLRPAVAAPDETASAAPSPPEPTSADPQPTPVVTAVTTLVIERVGLPQGVAVGLGELRRVSTGEVLPLRGAAPALRLVAGTGPLLVSFGSSADRDRVAAELLDESGFGPDGRPPATA